MISTNLKNTQKQQLNTQTRHYKQEHSKNKISSHHSCNYKQVHIIYS